MKKNYLGICLAVLFFTGLPNSGRTAPVTWDFIAYVESGPFAGTSGVGSFTYNDDDLGSPDDIISAEESLTVDFSYDGQDFNETHDESYDATPTLEFSDSEPILLDLLLKNGLNEVDFNDPDLDQLYIGLADLSPSSDPDYDFETELEATPVPIPSALWLFGTGIVGLVVLRNKKR